MENNVIRNEHDWADDPDEKAGGVLKCQRPGCLVRKAKIGGVWQRKKAPAVFTLEQVRKAMADVGLLNERDRLAVETVLDSLAALRKGTP